ncbi:MAG: Nif3-like dinuclear metal center hexameric protein [Propionibacteriales bacterium]|nr:Nif3-like dinuclear metal center hexameric protein [Propionibacteriales bacterium]
MAEVIACLDDLYDPRWADSWDAVGLVCGDPGQPVRKVLFAVDPVHAVADEAVGWGADLLVTHHPLLLKPVHGVAAIDPKGRVVHCLLTNGVALQVCHTNADSADPGVSDALAETLGLIDLRPLDAAPAEIGIADQPSSRGTGRLGVLPEPLTLQAFAERVADALPQTAAGVRAAGDPDQQVRTVAVCGGAGDGFLDLVRGSAADVYVTSDLRHHPASEFREHGYGGTGTALVDIAHWAAEWTWLPHAARRLVEGLATRGTTVETRVSRICTDPWQIHVPQHPMTPPEESPH